MSGISPAIGPFRPAPSLLVPTLDQPICRPNRKIQEKLGKRRITVGGDSAALCLGRARPQAFRPRPFPLSATPALALGLLGPSFLGFSPLPAGFVPALFPFLPSSHTHPPPSISTKSSTAFTITVAPRLSNFAPEEWALLESSPRKISRTQSREAGFRGDQDICLSIPAPSLPTAPASPLRKGR